MQQLEIAMPLNPVVAGVTRRIVERRPRRQDYLARIAAARVQDRTGGAFRAAICARHTAWSI